MGGLGIQNPVDMAIHVHIASKELCSYFVKKLLSHRYFDIGNHCHNVKFLCQEARKHGDFQHEAIQITGNRKASKANMILGLPNTCTHLKDHKV